MENTSLSGKELEVVENLNIPEEYKKDLLTSKTSAEFLEKLDNITRIGIKLLREQVIHLKGLRNELIRRLDDRGMTEQDLIDKLAGEEKYEEASKILNASKLIAKGEKTLADLENTLKRN